MDLRALDEPQPLEISLVDDINVLAGWEYWLKLSYFTADLHVVRAWRLNSRSTEAQFESQARVRLGVQEDTQVQMRAGKRVLCFFVLRVLC